jgi:hypothetical protein
VRAETSLNDFVLGARSLFDSEFSKPPFPYSAKTRPKAPPIGNPRRVGTAFDYAMRLCLAKLNHIPVDEIRLLAEKAATTRRRREFVRDFRVKLQCFLEGKSEINDLLADCIVLAKLEPLARGAPEYMYWSPDIFSVEDSDVEDVQNLVGLIDNERFVATSRCVLNPSFGERGSVVGDADFILDDAIVDIKTYKCLELKRQDFRQLLGYFTLNLRQDNVYGEVYKLGIYYSRFGILFTSLVQAPKNGWKTFRREFEAAIALWKEYSRDAEE